MLYHFKKDIAINKHAWYGNYQNIFPPQHNCYSRCSLIYLTALGL